MNEKGRVLAEIVCKAAPLRALLRAYLGENCPGNFPRGAPCKIFITGVAVS